MEEVKHRVQNNGETCATILAGHIFQASNNLFFFSYNNFFS